MMWAAARHHTDAMRTCRPEMSTVVALIDALVRSNRRFPVEVTAGTVLCRERSPTWCSLLAVAVRGSRRGPQFVRKHVVD